MADISNNSIQSINEDDKTCLSFAEKFTYAFGQMAVSLSPALISSWLIYFYTGRTTPDGQTIFLVSAMAMSLGGLIPRFIEAVAEPIVGHLSDKWNFRMGRRIPWVAFGTPFLMLFSVIIWFPPDAAGAGRLYFNLFGLDVTTNFMYLLFTHTGFWVLYTAVVAPYLSLLPEITPYNNERIKVSEYMAYSDVIGTALGSLGLGFMISAFAGGLRIGSFALDNAYQVSGLFIGLFFAISFYVSIWKVREKPFDKSKAVGFKFSESVVETFKNPTFPAYVTASAAIRMGVDVILAAMPFLVARLMGLSEGLAGALQGVIVLGAAFLFPLVSHLAEKHGKKKIFLLGLIWFVGCLVLLAMVKHFPLFGYPVAGVASLLGYHLTASWVSFSHAMVTLALTAFAVSIVFVLQRPILTDVIDYDEKLTTYRREAMYNGMEGLISKPASGIAYFIVPLLNKYLGATAEQPMGILAAPIVAAAILFVGWWFFRPYPIEK